MGRRSRKVQEAVETIVRPVTFLTDRFNALMKQLDYRAQHREVVSEVDGFVDALIEEVRDVEQGLFAFFGEILFIHNLNESLTQLENELAVVEILGKRTSQLLKPDFIAILMKRSGSAPLPVYRHPEEIPVSWEKVLDIARESFQREEAVLFENKLVDGVPHSILSVPLRTTSERMGLLIVGKQAGTGAFRSDETSLVIAGAALVSFMLSNIQLHQRILRDQRMVTVGKTIAGLAHDIRNILTNFEGGISLLESAVGDGDAQALSTAAGIIRRSHDRMKDYVLSMLDYSKDRPVDLQPLSLNAFLKELVSGRRPALEERGIVIREEYDGSIGELLLDPYLLDRIVTNLVANAADAVQSGTGRIEVATRLDPEGTLSLRVSDNGTGISPQVLDRIFDVFYSTKGSRGTGFGLAIVRKAVKELDGTVEVHSQPGRGTTFLVRLPVRLPRAAGG